MAKKLLEAIKFYHEQNILHGDIHSSNILIDENDNVHIIDFGASLFGQLIETEKTRESYFIYENILLILKGIIDEKFFKFKKISDIHCLKEDCVVDDIDVIKYNPYLVTLTLLAYVNYLDCYQQIVFDDFDMKDVYDLCSYLSKGIYFDYDYIFNDFLHFNKYLNNEIDEQRISKILNSYFEDNIFGCNQDEYNVVLVNKLLNIYYKFYKNNINTPIVIQDEDDKALYISKSLYESKFDNYIDYENYYETKSFQWLDNEFKDECKYLLYSVIFKYFNYDQFKTDNVIWEKFNEMDFMK